MIETLAIILSVIAVLAASFGMGRWLGGRWIAIFAVLMACVAALLFLSAMEATGAYAGMGELLIFFMVWLPALVCGLIGGIIGWVKRAKAQTPPVPPPVP